MGMLLHQQALTGCLLLWHTLEVGNTGPVLVQHSVMAETERGADYVVGTRENVCEGDTQTVSESI